MNVVLLYRHMGDPLALTPSSAFRSRPSVLLAGISQHCMRHESIHEHSSTPFGDPCAQSTDFMPIKFDSSFGLLLRLPLTPPLAPTQDFLQSYRLSQSLLSRP